MITGRCYCYRYRYRRDNNHDHHASLRRYIRDPKVDDHLEMQLLFRMILHPAGGESVILQQSPGIFCPRSEYTVPQSNELNRGPPELVYHESLDRQPSRSIDIVGKDDINHQSSYSGM
jgi:hypothetical protein